MASFGFSIGDIITGLQLALVIYNIGFVQENSADVRYKNFANDILNFRRLLERLNEALQNAQRRYIDRPRTTGLIAYEPLSDDFENERKAIVGDFVDTLKSCEALLEQNKHFRVRHSNVLENLHWHLSQQETRVDDLRRRLQLHSEKIRLVLDRLSIDLLTDIDGKLDDILELSQQNLNVASQTLFAVNRLQSTLVGHSTDHHDDTLLRVEDLHNASEDVIKRFEDNIYIGAPSGFDGNIPLVAAFDALLSHFEQASDGSDQTPEKYLAFLRARWLLEQIRASSEFRLARPGFYYKRAVNQVARAIAERISLPPGLIAYDESVLMNLPDACFYVWPPIDPSPSLQHSEPHPLMIRANEINVLSVTLPSSIPADADTITVFKSSEEHFRIIRETTLASRPGERILMTRSVVTSEDKLIPRYALPSLSHPAPDIAIFSRTEELLYRFENYNDLWSFQTALTGYEVSHDQGNIRCQISSDIKFLDKGRVQLWQEPIVLSADPALPLPSPGTSPGTQQSQVHESISRRDSIVPSIATTNTVHRTSEGWEAESIKVPTIVIFSQVQVRKKRRPFAIVSIELEPGVYVDPSECSCHKDYDSCSQLFITRRKKKQNQEMTVRVLVSDIGSSGLPDSNTFDLFPFRKPPHPARKKSTFDVRTDYLALKFDSLEEKKRFHEELELRMEVRDKQIKKQRKFAQAMQFLGNSKIKHWQQIYPLEGQEVCSPVAPEPKCSPPKLDVLDKFGSFNDSFTNQVLRNMSDSNTTDPPLPPNGQNTSDISDSRHQINQSLPNAGNQSSVQCRDSEQASRDRAKSRETHEAMIQSAIPKPASKPIPVSLTGRSNVGRLRNLWHSKS